LIDRIEEIGVLVMRRGDLGHSSKPLAVEEFRGFAIFDNFAPVIFINQSDVPSARLFTLIHELTHIWIGQSGISDGSPTTEHKEEILCNAVAAEFLVPSSEFLKLWGVYDKWENNLPDLRAHFHVSEWVLCRKALTLDLISHSEYSHYIAKLKRAYAERAKNGSGPTYYKTRKSQLSSSFARALTSEAMSGRILLRDAGHLLWMMKPHNITKFAKELGI
jgi:Zn-dependent peptidase ImmA (M78 family)